MNKTESIHELVWDKLTRGVTEKLETDGVRVDKWSPNNLRRLIVSPEGVVFQNFVTKGTFLRSPLTVVDFPVTDKTAQDLNSRTAVTSVLYKDRVFSSVEEVVLILNSPSIPYTLSPNEVVTLQRKLNSFKRLASIIIVKQPIPLKDFIASNIKVLGNPCTLLSEEGVLGNSEIFTINKDWYNHTALRPQFYSMDEDEKELSKYFKSVKEKLSNLNRDRVFSQKKVDSDKKEPESDENEKKSFSKQSKTILTYRLMQANFLKNREKSDGKLLWFSKYKSSDIRQLKKGLGFRDGQDENFNEALKRLGLYENEGSVDDERLKDIVGKQIIASTVSLIDSIKKNYPLFGKELDKKLRSNVSKNPSIDDMRKLALLDYRKPFEQSTALSNTEISVKERELLIDGLKGHAKDCIDVIAGVLFDLGYQVEDADMEIENGELSDIKSSVTGLDLVIMHDLYIFCNKVKHRMYNSLFGDMGYVTDQPVGERIRFLVKELDKEDEDEWVKCKEVINRIEEGKFKKSFESYKDDIVSSLRRLEYLDNAENSKKLHQVVRVTVEILEMLCRSDDRKLALVHAVGKVNDKLSTLGANGITVSGDTTVRKAIDFDKPADEKYSKYLKLIMSLVLTLV